MRVHVHVYDSSYFVLQNELLFGGDKGVGVSIAVLDKSGQEPSLLYLAASQPVADYVVGKRVPQSTVPVSVCMCVLFKQCWRVGQFQCHRHKNSCLHSQCH